MVLLGIAIKGLDIFLETGDIVDVLVLKVVMVGVEVKLVGGVVLLGIDIKDLTYMLYII